MKIHCDNCGAFLHKIEDEESLIYPCHKCGNEVEMGRSAKPLTIEEWVKVQRRLLGDLSRKLDNHKDIKNLIRINEETMSALGE